MGTEKSGSFISHRGLTWSEGRGARDTDSRPQKHRQHYQREVNMIWSEEQHHIPNTNPNTCQTIPYSPAHPAHISICVIFPCARVYLKEADKHILKSHILKRYWLISF